MPIKNNPFDKKAKASSRTKSVKFGPIFNPISALGLNKNPMARVKAQSLAERTRAIKPTYIGGKTDNARAEFWRQEPVMQHAVDSIANEYGINSDALKYRLDHEGFTDNAIKMRNYAVQNPNWADIEEYRGYSLLNGNKLASGISLFGLDDVATMIDEGKVNPINESWRDGTAINEKGRETHYATSDTVKGNIGLAAATLKYFTDKARKDNPTVSQTDVNRYGLAYYNRGVDGGRKWVSTDGKGYNYRRRLETRGSKSK